MRVGVGNHTDEPGELQLGAVGMEMGRGPERHPGPNPHTSHSSCCPGTTSHVLLLNHLVTGLSIWKPRKSSSEGGGSFQGWECEDGKAGRRCSGMFWSSSKSKAGGREQGNTDQEKRRGSECPQCEKTGPSGEGGARSGGDTAVVSMAHSRAQIHRGERHEVTTTLWKA